MVAHVCVDRDVRSLRNTDDQYVMSLVGLTVRKTVPSRRLLLAMITVVCMCVIFVFLKKYFTYKKILSSENICVAEPGHHKAFTVHGL